MPRIVAGPRGRGIVDISTRARWHLPVAWCGPPHQSLTRSFPAVAPVRVMLPPQSFEPREAGSMKRIALITAVAAAVLAAPAAASAAEYEGTVVSVNRDNRTFRLHDTERGTIRIKVTSRTRYERIAGFSGLRKGMTRIEATVRRSDGRWVALEVERSGGGGEHGGRDDD